MGTPGAGNTLSRIYIAATFASGVYTGINATPINLSGPSDVICAPNAMSLGPQFTTVDSGAAGRWAFSSIHTLSGNGKTLSPDSLYAIPYKLDEGWMVSSLVVSINTAAGTSANKLRVGLIEPSSTGGFGKLIAESTNIDPSTTGIKSASIVGGNKFIPAGHYWSVFLCDVGINVNAGVAGSTAGVNGPSVAGFSSGSNISSFISFGQVAITPGWTAIPDPPAALTSRTLLAGDFPPALYLGVL